MEQRKIRVLIAKPGLDGHDRSLMISPRDKEQFLVAVEAARRVAT